MQRCPAWLRKLLCVHPPCLTFFLTLCHWLWHRSVDTWLRLVAAGRWWLQPGRWKKQGALPQSSAGPIAAGSKELKGKTTAWCTLRNGYSGRRNGVRYSEKGTENWESSGLLMLAFARRCVSLHFHRVTCLRHVKIAAAESWGGSPPAMGTMAWLGARSASPPVLHT